MTFLMMDSHGPSWLLTKCLYMGVGHRYRQGIGNTLNVHGVPTAVQRVERHLRANALGFIHDNRRFPAVLSRRCPQWRRSSRLGKRTGSVSQNRTLGNAKLAARVMLISRNGKGREENSVPGSQKCLK